MPLEERKLLQRTAADLGVFLEEAHLDAFGTYLDELCLWNRRMNLTGLHSRKRMAVELVADSLVPVPRLPDTGTLLDVGSGAGFPGIPIKILKPALSVDLLEPSAKKQAFLKQAVRLLGLKDLRTLRGRAGNADPGLRAQGYDVVTARAVAGLREAVRLCAPHILPGGLLVGFVGGRREIALRDASERLSEAELELEASMCYRLPGMEGSRHTLLFRRRATS